MKYYSNEKEFTLTKIQVNYINFLTKFINKIFNAIGKEKLSFHQLKNDLKKNISKDSRDKLNSSTIEEILNTEISEKYTIKNKDK